MRIYNDITSCKTFPHASLDIWLLSIRNVKTDVTNGSLKSRIVSSLSLNFLGFFRIKILMATSTDRNMLTISSETNQRPPPIFPID